MAIPVLRLKRGQHQGAPIPDPRAPWVSHAYSIKGVIIPLVLLGLAVLVLPYDVVISYHCYKVYAGGMSVLKDILNHSEPFGHCVGVVIVGSAILLIAEKQWKTGFSLMTAGIGAGLIADAVKLLVARCRARNYDFSSMMGTDTFLAWLPGFGQNSGTQSFPSAHSATAAAMAVMLSTIYPRATALFAVVAVLVMAHRLHMGAHYLSDILVGAAIGWLFAIWCVRLAVKYRYLILDDSLLQPPHN